MCETNSKRIYDESIIMVFGTTGAGKTTLIQYLYGALMAEFEGGHIQA